MTEAILLLPQWAESLQEQRSQHWHLFKEGLLAIVQSIRTAVTTVVTAFVEAVQPILDVVERALCPTTRRTQPKRSSRRLKVQAKRKALGLTTEGKLPPEWAKGYHYSRKESLQIAIRRDRIVRDFDLPWLKIGVLS